MFGTTEIVVTQVTKDSDATDIFILDLKRVFSIDTASMKLLSQLCEMLLQRNKYLFFVNAKDNFAFNRFIKKALKDTQDPDCLYFSLKDEAIEWCETKLLKDSGHTASGGPAAWSKQCLLQGMSAAEIEQITAVVKEVNYKAGELIFSADTPADKVYFIGAGEVSIDLPVRRAPTRLAKLTPGMSFGELALVEDGMRTALARALTDVKCYELSREFVINELPEAIRYKLIVNVSRQLAQNLRTANNEIAALM